MRPDEDEAVSFGEGGFSIEPQSTGRGATGERVFARAPFGGEIIKGTYAELCAQIARLNKYTYDVDTMTRVILPKSRGLTKESRRAARERQGSEGYMKSVGIGGQPKGDDELRTSAWRRVTAHIKIVPLREVLNGDPADFEPHWIWQGMTKGGPTTTWRGHTVNPARVLIMLALELPDLPTKVHRGCAQKNCVNPLHYHVLRQLNALYPQPEDRIPLEDIT